jgi:hypothetical protein
MLYPPPSPLPVAYRSNGRRTRAADIDAGGRRGGNPEDNHKDPLPAYDNVGGPPKYIEVDMDAGTRLHLDLAGVVEREASRGTPDDEQDTPRQSVEETALNSRSHLVRPSSDQSERNNQQSGPDTPALEHPGSHHPA